MEREDKEKDAFVHAFLKGKVKWFNSRKGEYRVIIMSKRYSGKSFKDSSVKKKPKLNFKEKRKLKREKRKK